MLSPHFLPTKKNHSESKGSPKVLLRGYGHNERAIGSRSSEAAAGGFFCEAK